jgi:iron complex transport system substrate-binding protein
MQRRTFIGALGALSLAGAGTAARAAETIAIEAADAAGRWKRVTLPASPQRLAVADFAVLDTLDAWGLGGRIKGLTKMQKLPYAAKYFAKDNGIAYLGSLREVNLEGLMDLSPDVIFASARLRRRFGELSRIAPVVSLPVDWNLGDAASCERITTSLGTLFGREVEAEKAIADARARIARLREKARGHTALVGLVTSAHVNLLGDKARCSVIGREIGFTNLAAGANATHGSESSFELIMKLDPEYLFVLDRDSAIGREGAKLARDVLDNELIRGTRAARENKIVYLDAPAWYLAEGGVRAMDRMLGDIERALSGAAAS